MVRINIMKYLAALHSKGGTALIEQLQSRYQGLPGLILGFSDISFMAYQDTCLFIYVLCVLFIHNKSILRNDIFCVAYYFCWVFSFIFFDLPRYMLIYVLHVMFIQNKFHVQKYMFQKSYILCCLLFLKSHVQSDLELRYFFWKKWEFVFTFFYFPIFTNNA